MLLIGADIETTGLLAPDGTPGDHRIIEFYGGLYDIATRTKVDSLFLRFNPQRSIQPAAQAVHKIAITDLAHEPLWKDEAPRVRAFLERGDIVVGHNWNGFDAPFVDGELKRVGQAPLTRPTFDTMLEGRWAKPMGEIPSLGALCWACDVPYDASKAHAADYDVDVMIDCVWRALDWGFFALPSLAAAA